MPSFTRMLSPARNIDSLIAAAGGILIICFFTRHSGIGISPDSVTYISAARNLNAGSGLTTFYGTPLVDFPFFYPCFLAAITWLSRFDVMQFGPVLNEILFGLLIYLSGGMMNLFQPASRWMKVITLSCLVLSPCLLEVYSMIWSETLFLLLVMIFLVMQYRYSRTHSLRTLLLLAFIAALSAVTRYSGVTVIGTGGLLLLFDRNLAGRKKFRHLFLYSVIAVSLLSINLLRNSWIEGSFTGNRQKGITPLSQNIYFFGSVIGEWFPLPSGSHPFLLITGWVTLAFFTVTMAWVFWGAIRDPSIERIATVFAGIYALFIVFSSTFSRYEQINSRLLAAIFIPLLWTTGAILMNGLQRSRVPTRYAWIIAGVALAILLQNKQWKADYETWDGVKDAGIPGYTEDPWKFSPTVQYLQNNPVLFQQGRTVYSNASDAVYFYTGQSSFLLPQKAFPGEVGKFYAAKNIYLVWFNETGNDALPDLPDILQQRKLKLVAGFADGAVYFSE